MIRILIVDDHEIMRQGLVSLFEREADFEVVGEAGDGEEALVKVAELDPDVVLLDIKMPKIDGLSAAALIHERHPQTKTIILTAVEDDEEVFEAIESGIDGYLLKSASSAELMWAVRVVNEGEKYLHPLVTRKVMDRISNRPEVVGERQPQLTERELKVLKLMAQGYKNREIASKLFLGEETVKSHVSNILNKLEQTDRVQAVFYALRNGLIKIEE